MWPFLLALGVLGNGVLLAQSSPLPAAVVPATDPAETVVLSPFEVVTSSDTGYNPSETVSGTRLRSNTKDTSSSLTILTPQLLDDLGIVNAEEALSFVANTEPYGITDDDTAAFNGNFLPPIEGRGDEAGVRFDVLGGKLTGTVAHYDTTERNRADNLVSKNKQVWVQYMWDAIKGPGYYIAPANPFTDLVDRRSSGYELQLTSSPVDTRKWIGSLAVTYLLPKNLLPGLRATGRASWRSAPVIGYLLDGQTAVNGRSEGTYDFSLSYEHRIRIGNTPVLASLTAQVLNLVDTRRPIPFSAVAYGAGPSDYYVSNQRLPAPRLFQYSLRLQF